jgi:hypothetical protein
MTDQDERVAELDRQLRLSQRVGCFVLAVASVLLLVWVLR